MHFKKIVLAIALLMTNFLFSQTTEQTIVDEVEKNTSLFLSKIPVGSESHFGFDSRDDFDNCTVGKPIRVITIDANEIFNQLNEWRVPILLDGVNRVLFTVIQHDGKFKIVDIGGKGLAQELQSLQDCEHTYLYLFRLYKQNMDFITSCTDEIDIEKALFTPLISASRNIDFTIDSKRSFSFQEIVAILY